MCRHCRMDDVWVGWETRLFRLEARAMGAGSYVSHEDAVRQVRQLQPDEKESPAAHCMSASLANPEEVVVQTPETSMTGSMSMSGSACRRRRPRCAGSRKGAWMRLPSCMQRAWPATLARQGAGQQ